MSEHIHEPRVHLVGMPIVNWSIGGVGLSDFLEENNCIDGIPRAMRQTGAEVLCETAGRLCYMSYGKGRKSNREYLEHILSVGHGSVLEHANWNFIIENVSRSFTHELVRHRVGFSYSQLSQRYVDESETEFIEPDCIADSKAAHKIFSETVEYTKAAYAKLVKILAEKFKDEPDKTLRRKKARQAARAVLPNATETKIFVTANARALRNFFELRANEHADVEIRKVAVKMLKLMQREAPALFGDYELTPLQDGTEAVKTKWRKV